MKIATGVPLLAIFGCAGSIGVEGVVDTDGANKQIRIVSGYDWIIPRGKEMDLEVDTTGHFQLPPSQRTVTAYVDVNANGHLDGLEEPSAWCSRPDGRWRCAISTDIVTVYRVNSVYDADRHDALQVFVQGYTDSWDIDPAFSACSDEGQCAEFAEVDFVTGTSRVKTFSGCSHDWSKPLRIVAATGTAKTTSSVVAPEALSVRLQTEWTAHGDAEVHAEVAGPDPDRIIVWFAEIDSGGRPTAFHWTSEDRAGAIVSVRRHRYDSTIPASAVQRCRTACAIGFQAVKRELRDRVNLLSEGRAVARVTL